MPEWVRLLIPGDADFPTTRVVVRLVQAAVLGLAVAAIYYLTQRKRRAEAAPFVATLVLLGVLIAMVTQVIGENIARAFSLAGALAIIRFRTVVDDTRDTAFVIAAVVVGMAVGADNLAVAIAGVPVTAAAAWALSAWGGYGAKAHRGTLAVRLGAGITPEAALAAVFARHLDGPKLLAAATARQGAALDLTYTTGLKPGATTLALFADLNRVEGVQGVEWKESGGE